jgi:hypothetical protein
MGKLAIIPLTVKEANRLVGRWHRSHKPVQGGLCAIGVCRDGEDEPCGAAILGRPQARMSDDGWTIEITRLVTDGTPYACSRLWGRALRVARQLGYRRVISYSEPHEGGASLRAVATLRLVSVDAGGGSWSRDGRPRVDEHPTQPKFKWEATVTLNRAGEPAGEMR